MYFSVAAFYNECNNTDCMVDKRLLIKFGKNLREERMKAGLTQDELSLEAGFPRSYIGKVERGEMNITLLSMHRIAKALHILVTRLVS